MFLPKPLLFCIVADELRGLFRGFYFLYMYKFGPPFVGLQLVSHYLGTGYKVQEGVGRKNWISGRHGFSGPPFQVINTKNCSPPFKS